MYKDRMQTIGRWSLPPKGTIERKYFERYLADFEKSNPGIDVEIKKAHNEGLALDIIQSENGAGLPADIIIREYLAEYNNRALHISLSDLPGSFNVAGAFGDFSPPPFIFQINEEKNYVFSLTDFLDYVTSDDVPSDAESIEDVMEDETIYSYNSVDSPLNNIFSTSDELEFGVQSISLIRHSNEVSILMLAGQLCDLEEETGDLIKIFNDTEKAVAYNDVTPDESLKIHAVPLIEGSQLWKTIVLVRLDLNTSTIDARYVYKDSGRAYSGITDDINTWIDHNGDFLNQEVENAFYKNKKNVDKYNPLFEVCKTAVYLPFFSKEFEDVISVERHQTKYFTNASKVKYRKINSLVNRSHKKTFRNVEKATPSKRRHPAFREFITPEMKVETSGYWKKLDFGNVGKDKVGQPIQGRTWVSKILTWEESDAKPSSLRVNSRKNINIENQGYIYVMHSAAHGKNIFKVGLTRRNPEVRSDELSRATGVPDHFLVVEDWEVSDCVLAEKMIHERLAEYRFNPKREFFKVRYKVIFKVIDEVIEEINTLDKAR